VNAGIRGCGNSEQPYALGVHSAKEEYRTDVVSYQFRPVIPYALPAKLPLQRKYVHVIAVDRRI